MNVLVMMPDEDAAEAAIEKHGFATLWGSRGSVVKVEDCTRFIGKKDGAVEFRFDQDGDEDGIELGGMGEKVEVIDGIDLKEPGEGY